LIPFLKERKKKEGGVCGKLLKDVSTWKKVFGQGATMPPAPQATAVVTAVVIGSGSLRFRPH